MIRGAVRRIRRSVGGAGRWVRPGRAGVVVLVAVVAGAVGGAGWIWSWAVSSASPAHTLALAASVHRDPIVLDSALEVTWDWSVGGTTALEERWLSLVAPALPPGLCPSPAPDTSRTPGSGRTGEAGLPSALRRLHGAVDRGAGRDELERRISEVRSIAAVDEGSRTAFLVRYGLARGYAAAGDGATAAEVLDPVFEGYLSRSRVPDTGPSRARRLVEEGRMTRELAVDAVHGRYLAGTLAYRRDAPGTAVARFRRAINAFYYLLALEGDGALGSGGHHRRVSAGAGSDGCPGSADPLTSLDAYAGLVASYMADADFSDPGGLSGEIRRTPLQMDRDDPFRPVLEHARITGADPARTPVAENLLWAASNLQRVYHHNRLRPEPRLEVTRAVLLLHLTRDSARVEALRAEGGADVCSMLETLGSDLHSDAAARELGRRSEPSVVDSARAAVAVQTFARLDRGCTGADVPALEPPVRSAWIRLAGGYLTGGVASRYEEIRTELESQLSGGGQPVPVLEERITPPVDRVRNDLRALRRGRIPPALPAGLPAEPVRRYLDDWWDAVFADVATTLAGGARETTAGIRAGEVPAYLRALESATAHAGMRPGDVYRPSELAPLAGAAGGWSAALSWRLRSWVRSRPVASAGILGLAVLAVAVLALLLHVSWWRYRLLVDQRLWSEEVERREGRAVA